MHFTVNNIIIRRDFLLSTQNVNIAMLTRPREIWRVSNPAGLGIEIKIQKKQDLFLRCVSFYFSRVGCACKMPR